MTGEVAAKPKAAERIQDAARELFHRQGYRSAFYIGTDSDFDNERGYLQLQGVDDIIDLRNFGPGYRVCSAQKSDSLMLLLYRWPSLTIRRCGRP